MYKEFFDSMNSFVDKLQDEESVRIFEARFKYFIDKDIDSLEDSLVKEAEKYRNSCRSWILEAFYKKYPDKKSKSIAVFGAGVFGRSSIRSLKTLDIEVEVVIDNNFEKIIEVEGIKVLSPEILKKEKDKYIVIVAVANLEWQMSIYYQLTEMGISADNILLTKSGSIWCDYGNQYFDLNKLPINPEGEIFVDAGCFDGMSSVNAKKWAGNALLKIYAFEPDKNNFEICKDCLQSIGCEFEVFNEATWSSKRQLTFEINAFGHASKITKEGNEIVNTNSLDNVLDGRPVTYIKLDVEGSELETLKGAVESIKRYRPKLAISLYHKPEDIVEIPVFIESLGMDYKYYIRHYQTRWCETTLYAF